MFVAVPDRNLILTGYTGPNQQSVGQQVADRLRMRFVNVDAQLEARAGFEIEDLRTRYGETRLKMLESEVMQDVLLYRSAVIGISGQTILRGEYGARLMETGPIFCQVVTLDVVLQRLHLALGGRYHIPAERALALGRLKREWAVRDLEGVIEVDTTYLTIPQIVETIVERWRELAGGVLLPARGPAQ
ncbi:MAG: hypothetical protein JNM70_09850 [Anaerolineae bacterium]|nr:hypothetical protein [Anaerolineae bacterium]